MSTFRVKPLRAAARAVALVLTRTPLLDALAEASDVAGERTNFSHVTNFSAGERLRLAAALLDRATAKPMSSDEVTGVPFQMGTADIAERIADSGVIRYAAANAERLAADARVMAACRGSPADAAFDHAAYAAMVAASMASRLDKLSMLARDPTGSSEWVLSRWRKQLPNDAKSVRAKLRAAFEIYGERSGDVFDATWADALARASAKATR